MDARRTEKKIADLLQGIDVDRWRVVTAKNSLQSVGASVALLFKTLRLNLVCQFNKAADPGGHNPVLSHALAHHGALGPVSAVRKMLLIRACLNKWEAAKKADDFSIVAPVLQKLVNLMRKEAQGKAERLGLSSPYDAVLDYQTPGMRKEHFERWADDLVPFYRAACDRLAGEKGAPVAFVPMAQKDQQRLMQNVLGGMGVDLNRLAIGDAPHPLCIGMGDQVRMGMNFDEGDSLKIVLDSFHEGGHALYRQNLPRGGAHPLEGLIAGAGMDEAMALIMENHVCRTDEQAQCLSAAFAAAYGLEAKAGSIRNAFRQIDQTGLRLKADEVRYPLDVILRYRVEKALFDDALAVADIPAFWAAEFKNLTGMEVRGDRNGALQDIHMYAGEFGWSPNYLFGQLAAAQLFETVSRERPEMMQDLAGEGTRVLVNWLNDHIYSQGRKMTAPELVRLVTGEVLGTGAYKRHIQARYFGPQDGFTPHRMPLPPGDQPRA